ncbi:MAG: hypothetical protein VXY93_12600, partial [Pseudomonadota bacterium]|nr:hypothetical protein [Pseudomonadota bacterium]
GGDLWWDSDVGELYIYYSDTDSNQWVETSGGSETVTVSDNAPSSPNHGDLWWESDTGQLKIYYNDGDSAQWVDANAGVLSSLTVWQSNSTGINTTSNVGIGTTTADAALTVDGNARITGISTFRDIDVDGHTNLDNVSISGVTTMTGMLRIDSGNLQVYGTAPNIFLRDTNDNPDYRFMNSHGSIKIFDETNGLDRFIINPSGKVSVLYDLDVDGHTELDNVSIAGVTTVTGDVNVGTSQASGVILTSPNGTRYRLVVANDGTLSTTAA